MLCGLCANDAVWERGGVYRCAEHISQRTHNADGEMESALVEVQTGGANPEATWLDPDALAARSTGTASP